MVGEAINKKCFTSISIVIVTQGNSVLGVSMNGCHFQRGHEKRVENMALLFQSIEVCMSKILYTLSILFMHVTYTCLEICTIVYEIKPLI